MSDPIADLGDFICETLTFCYSREHKKSLEKDAKKMGGTFEQFIAAALAQRIGRNLRFAKRLDGDPQTIELIRRKWTVVSNCLVR